LSAADPAVVRRGKGLRARIGKIIVMISIPPGEVTLSDRRTQRSWSVELAPFQLAAFPVTQAQYAAITGQRPSTAHGDQLPVENISWYDAVRFCNALSDREHLAPAYHFHADGEGVEWDTDADGYRLPTEAEWEYACRAGTSGPRYGPLDEIGWYRGNSGERVHRVGGKRPNAWGLHDMLGNVWDWCWDIYDAEVYGGYRVLRGGGWFDEPWSCRASVRRRSHPSLRIEDVGFRLARSTSHNLVDQSRIAG
jgi:formylglycine-generating enzyme